MPSQPKPTGLPHDGQLAHDETELRQRLAANPAEGLALSEFTSALPGRERMTNSQVLQAFRPAQRDGEPED
jgi:hypothetical protein